MSRLGNLRPSTLKTPLHLPIAHDENILLIAADKLDLLLDSRIQLVQASDNMAEIEHGAAFVVDLVENIVAEELEHVALAILRPLPIAVVFLALVDTPQLGHEAKEVVVAACTRSVSVSGAKTACIAAACQCA